MSALVAERVRITRQGTEFSVNGVAARLPLIGEHFVDRALDSVSSAIAAGASLDDAIAQAVAEQPRSDDMRVLEPQPGILVLNDAAEATPHTMARALKTLAELALDGSRSIAVLGELSDVGDDWRDEHDRIGRLVVRLNIAKLVVVGHGARHIHNAAGLEGSWNGESVLVDSAVEAYDLLREDVRVGDVVLVKSSAQAALSALGDKLGGVAA